MNKTIIKLQGKVFLSLATIGVVVGNIALAAGCNGGLYEPKKPDILKNEK